MFIPLMSEEESPFLRFFLRLRSLKKLPNDWNSYGSAPPNRVAIFRARRVLQELLRANFPPTAIKPSPDEGVGIVFVSASGQSTIECLNTGNILMILSQHGEPKVRYINQSSEHIQHAIEEIQTFLN
jgi:hypothetical protein